MLVKIAKLAVFGWLLAVLLLSSHHHGKPREGTTNFWVDFTIVVLNFAALTAGGFFTPIV